MKSHPFQTKQMKASKYLLCLTFCIILAETGFQPNTTGRAPEGVPPVKSPSLFSLLPGKHTNVHFNNMLPEINEINILVYQYFYNGGGVAIGDINNDNLADIYFTGNLVPNSLYLNKGNFQFEDITEKAEVRGTLGWTTGVTMADVNSDGFIDIYVCRSGKVSEEQRANELFINNGDLTFTERAAEYGLADPAYSTQAAFFDYDRDGDLDMFLLNHSIETHTNVDVREIRSRRDPYAGDKLYRNDGNGFTDVSEEAGIYGHPLGFGLGISVGDLNNDGWPDLYVGNDFLEQDYLYVNNGDGTFTEKLKESVKHTSLYSMGTDIADFNNDGWLDIMVLDMVAEDNYRQKTNMSGMNRSKFYKAVKHGFHYQYMFNTLQLNNGNGSFSEIGQLAGVSNTDWSWAPLMTDLDNDGFKDIFITNGSRRDATNNDYIIFLKERFQEVEAQLQSGSYHGVPTLNRKSLVELVEKIPSEKIRNYVYQNNGDLTFTIMTADWGMDQASFSNGAAYADLDNDGDLDLVINNIDEEAFVYRNNSREINKNHYLRIQLGGPSKNPDGIGTSIRIRTEDRQQLQELYLTRGYQSSVEPTVHFGLGDAEKVEEVVINWPDGKSQVIKDVSADQVLAVSYAAARTVRVNEKHTRQPLFVDYTQRSNVTYKHQENAYDDFEKESLLPHKMSRFGPGVAVGDVNGDGLQDFYVGAAKGFVGKLFLQKEGQTFEDSGSQPWIDDRQCEDLGAAFFDADGDGDLDLYVVSGGNEFEPGAPQLQDRLYFNDGKGSFRKSIYALPQMLTSGSCVASGDYDQDGDMDVFVGGRLIPGKYPFAPRSYLLRNDNGKFMDVTEEVAGDLFEAGLVTDAIWTDFNDDQQLDLIVVGEWMPILMLENDGGKFSNTTNEAGLENSSGWWSSIASADFDNDGDVDYVVGNLGLNYKYKATEHEPFRVYCSDFDENGSLDIVLGYYNEGELYPLRGRQCSSEQMPFIKTKFPSYTQFGLASLRDVYGEESLNDALHYEVKTFATSLIENLGNGRFIMRALPNTAQLSSVNGILTEDFDGNGNRDIVIAGNLYAAEVETPRNDAGIGLFLKGDGKGSFQAVTVRESGLFADGDVRGLALINLGSKGVRGILVSKNDDYLQLIKVIDRP